MTVPVIASWTVNDSVGSPVTSITLTKPTGATINVGDLLIIIAANDSASDTAQWDDSTNKPTGFTLIKELGTASQDCHAAAFWRIADDTEGVDISLPAVHSNELIGWYLHITGNHATPIHKIGADSLEGSSATLAITGVTTTVADCLIFYLHSYDGGDGNPFSVTGTGFTELDEQNSGTGSSDCCASIGTRELASAGASGTATVANTTLDDGWAGFQFAIKPVVAGGANPKGPLGLPLTGVFGGPI